MKVRILTCACAAVFAAGLLSAIVSRADEKSDKFHAIDLKPYANRKLLDNLGRGADNNSLNQLPQGEQVLGGVTFQVGPGLIQLGSTLFRNFPEKVGEIAVDRKFARLHILQATCNGGGPNEEGGDGWVKDGTPIGQYVVRYDDGTEEAIAITYGEDVRDWWYVDGEAEPSHGKVVWKGDNPYATEIGAHLRLYTTSWTNPKPDKKVKQIDYLSRKADTPCAPFCISMSAEEK
jgi:hypothetical protein